MREFENLLQTMTPKSAILIILIAGIGDFILASKAIRAIRKGHPHSEIHLLTCTEAVPLARNYPYLDHVYSFPIRELRTNKRRLADVLKIILGLRKKTFTSILNLYRVSSFPGALKMGILFSLLKGENKFGHDRHGFGQFLTASVPACTFENRHIVDSMVAIAMIAGGINDEDGIEVFWRDEVVSPWEDFFASLRGKVIVGINPGGDRKNRRWAPDSFAAVGREMVRRYGAEVVLLGGTADVPVTSHIAEKIPANVFNLAGRTSVDVLPYLISRMDLLVTNDSGPMHIAAATRTPLVALFGPEDPSLFGPYGDKERYRILFKGLPCQPCGDRECEPLMCLNMITPEDVMAACSELLPRNV